MVKTSSKKVSWDGFEGFWYLLRRCRRTLRISFQRLDARENLTKRFFDLKTFYQESKPKSDSQATVRLYISEGSGRTEGDFVAFAATEP